MKQAAWMCLLFCVGCHSGASTQSGGSGSSDDWITGREALQRIVTSAKQWSPDAEVIRLYSGICKKAPREGTCNEWRAVVLSVPKKKSTGFDWRTGAVTQSEVSDYEPKDKQGAIDPGRIKADSDSAFRVAEEHGGKPLLERNPETEIRYAMMWDKGVGRLIWLVFYDIKGTDFSSAKLHVATNAETGEFLQ